MKKRPGAGFTMVELIVALALASVVTLSMVTVIVPAYQTYQRTLLRSDAQLVAGNVLDSIRAGASNAAEISARNGNQLDIGRGVYLLSDGKLAFQTVDENNQSVTEPVFDTGYYGGKTLNMTCENAGRNRVAVTVTVSGGGLDLCTASAVISPLRLVLEDTSDAETMQQAAQKVLSDNPKLWATKWFEELYLHVYGGVFPTIRPTEILPEAKLQDLLKQSISKDAKKFYQALLNETNTFYIATYYAPLSGGGAFPLVYVTDQNGIARLKKQPHAESYFVYYEGQWYVRTAAKIDWMTEFQNRTRQEIIGRITNTDGSNAWTNVNDL